MIKQSNKKIAEQFKKDRPRKIKIAEFCGWTEIHKGGFKNRSDLGRAPGQENDFSHHHIPSYEASLDAMREFEMRAAKEHGLWQNYLKALIEEVADKSVAPQASGL